MSCDKDYLRASAGIRPADADMLQSTMQGGVPERRLSFDTADDKFEEMVSTSKLVPFLFP